MITALDYKLLNLIQQIRTPALDASMKLFSLLGSTALVWIIAAVILMARKKSRKNGICVGASMLLGLFLGGLILKHIFVRLRPFENPLGLLSASDLIISLPSDRFSFPSSHSVTSFAAAASLFMYNKRLGIFAYALAGLIALSRLYLYVHFPTDVLCGSALGVLCALVTKKLLSYTKKSN